MPVDNAATTPRARALAAALRDIREHAGIGGRELGRRLGLSHSVISHWETGRRVPGPEEVASLLTALRVIGAEKQSVLELARHANTANWLSAGVPGHSHILSAIMESERTASSITEWSTCLVPGLLQTTSYTRAMLVTAGRSDEVVDAGAMVRAGRKEILAGRRAPEFYALLSETAVREHLGEPAVMSEQLRHLADIGKRPNITLQVIRNGIGWHPGMSGPFVLYDFPDSPATLYFEHYRSSAFDPDPKDVAAYREAIATMGNVALSPEATRDFLATLAEEVYQEE